VAAKYPPDLHVTRDLRFETLKTATDHAFVWAPVQPNACTESGAVRLGAIGTMIDSAGAVVALASASPDWIATSNLSYHRVGPVREGPIICSSRLVRAGATTIVVGVDVFDGRGSDTTEGGLLCGHGLMTFARIPGSASSITIDPFANIGVRSTNALAGSGFDEPLFDKIGIRVVDAAAGVVELDKHDYVRNSFGTINGGAVCMIFEAAAEVAARAIGSRAYESADLAVHYLAQTRTGPARTATTVLRHDERHALCQIRLVDAGNDDLLLAMATVTLVA
jgi:acyl-coenzyme A thioesterase PaaI-like protein